MNFCKDCKHIERNDLGRVAADANCQHPSATVSFWNLVTGEETKVERSASDMRKTAASLPTDKFPAGVAWCGADGTLFESV